MTTSDRTRPSVDTRTRPITGLPSVDAHEFFADRWRDALARHGERATDDATRLGLPPLAIHVDGDVFTLRVGDGTIAVAPGATPTRSSR